MKKDEVENIEPGISELDADWDFIDELAYPSDPYIDLDDGDIIVCSDVELARAVMELKNMIDKLKTL